MAWTIELPIAAINISNRKPLARCRCDCGVVRVVRLDSIRRGKSVFCGHCIYSSKLRAERHNDRTTYHGKPYTCHGEARPGKETPEYRVWARMKSRCLVKTDPAYDDYGGRGITIFLGWEKYETFRDYLLSSIGRRPSSKYSIDRIDNDGNYEPGNIRWATRSEQRKNQRHRKRKPLKLLST